MVVAEGRVAVREAVVEVAVRLEGVVVEVGFPTGLAVFEVAVREVVDAAEPVTLNLRSAVEAIFGFNGA